MDQNKEMDRNNFKINICWIVSIALPIALYILYTILWTFMILDTELRTQTDFLSMYSAGYIAKEIGYEKVYDISSQKYIQSTLLNTTLPDSLVLLYIHLPYMIPLLQIIISESYTISFIRWVLLNISVFISSSLILIKTFQLKKEQVVRCALASLTFFPAFICLFQGQDSFFCLLGLSVLYWGFINDREFIAGFGLSLVSLRPHIALFLAIPFLFKKQKVFFSALIGTGFFILISVYILGIDGIESFINILSISLEGSWYGMSFDTMYNFQGLLVRIIPNLEPTSITYTWILYFFILLILSIWWLLSDSVTITHLGLATLLSIFLASLNEKEHNKEIRNYIFPLLLFFGMGIVDSTVKFNQEEYLQNTGVLESTTIVFNVSAIIGIIVLLFFKLKKVKINARTLMFGIMLGLANFGSLYFLIMSLNAKFLDSSVIFAINNIHSLGTVISKKTNKPCCAKGGDHGTYHIDGLRSHRRPGHHCLYIHYRLFRRAGVRNAAVFATGP